MHPYYYVFCANQGYPTVRHPSRGIATSEAERLAAKHPGISFEILKCVGISSVPNNPPSTFWMDGEYPNHAPPKP